VLADAMEQTVDFDLLEAIAAAAPPLLFDPILLEPVGREIPIAVADDPAFCFYYRDSLDLLERLGARLIPFSPLSDAAPPPEACGLLLGGGYPELYAPQLSENLPMRRQLAAAVSGGLPTIAECGGFLYLHRRLQTDRGDWFEMAGVLPGDGFPTGKLSRFGYVTLTAQANGMLCDAGGQIRAHEFHYWDSTACGDAFLAQKPLRTVGWRCAHTSGSLYAGFPHVYFYSNIAFAQRFVTQCARFGQKQP
ncbi:MAG: cobyrinic acid a,c-diamide synthase, partial [Oscillospiraceae bacterium]